MKTIKEVLMERDGLTAREAKDKIAEVRQMIAESDYDYNEVEDIMASELGLEMDYVFELI